MLSFQPEIAAAADAGAIEPSVAARLIAIERREIVPIARELRALAWVGVMLVATGVGIIIKKHFHQIGPLAIAVAIGAAALSCFVFAYWRPKAAHNISEYVVLLGALLVSADVAFIEAQWHLLGGEWQRHFLLLAIVHAVVAYAFDSRAVLSLSVAAFAAWMGIEQRNVFQTEIEMAMRAFVCAGALAIFRIANRREEFKPVFDHFATNIAFWGALILTSNSDTRFVGLTLTIVFATVSLVYGVRRRFEAFIIYAVVYALIGVNVAVLETLHEEILRAAFLVTSTVAAIVTLTIVHFRLRKAEA